MAATDSPGGPRMAGDHPHRDTFLQRNKDDIQRPTTMHGHLVGMKFQPKVLGIGNTVHHTMKTSCDRE